MKALTDHYGQHGYRSGLSMPPRGRKTGRLRWLSLVAIVFALVVVSGCGGDAGSATPATTTVQTPRDAEMDAARNANSAQNDRERSDPSRESDRSAKLGKAQGNDDRGGSQAHGQARDP